jgi:hypothetical protein
MSVSVTPIDGDGVRDNHNTYSLFLGDRRANIAISSIMRGTFDEGTVVQPHRHPQLRMEPPFSSRTDQQTTHRTPAGNENSPRDPSPCVSWDILLTMH